MRPRNPALTSAEEGIGEGIGGNIRLRTILTTAHSEYNDCASFAEKNAMASRAVTSFQKTVYTIATFLAPTNTPLSSVYLFWLGSAGCAPYFHRVSPSAIRSVKSWMSSQNTPLRQNFRMSSQDGKALVRIRPDGHPRFAPD